MAYLNFFVGMAVFFGGILGGALATIVPKLFGYRLLSLFCISSALRFVLIWFIAGAIKEVRPIEKMRTKDIIMGVAGFTSLD
jgi:uncharacterized membrane protein YfcA